MDFRHNHFTIVLGAFLTSLYVFSARVDAATTINARSPSFADVATAVTTAQDGDTVSVPAGSATWTTALTISKGITLQGATRITTNTSAHPPTYGISPDSASTVITTNVTVITAHVPSGKIFRVSGFTFRQNGTPGSGQTITINGSGTTYADVSRIRTDNCYFASLRNTCNIFVTGWAYGVVDHCIFDVIGNGGASVRVFHDSWNRSQHGWGSWADDPYWGSDRFIFIEDCVMNNLTSAVERGSIDSKQGGRYVARHNWFHGCNLNPHGTEESGGVAERGVKQTEVYQNYFSPSTSNPHPGSGQQRGGTILLHDNQYVGYGGATALTLYRRYQFDLGNSGSKNTPTQFAWCGGSGFSPWDCNATELDQSHVDGHPPYVFNSGKHTGANGYLGIVDTSKNWIPGQWKGFSVQNTNPSSVYFNGFNRIYDNTATELIIHGSPPLGPDCRWNAGDSYRIGKCIRAIDQGGSGKSDPLQNNQLTNPPYPKWLNQGREPAYSWNNTLDGRAINFQHDPGNPFDVLSAVIDYINGIPKPGYTPYTYPHPLTGPLPPTNLTVTQ